MTNTITVRTYAEAQAVAICWMAGFRGTLKPATWDGMHSELCGWCDYPAELKMAAVDDYNAWPGNAGQRKDFFTLPFTVRRRLIREAQGYPEFAREPALDDA